MPASPTRPVPRSPRVPGSGTAVTALESPLLNLTCPAPPTPNGFLPVKVVFPDVTLMMVGTPFRVPVAVRVNANEPPPVTLDSDQVPPALIVPTNVQEPPVMVIVPPVMVELAAGLLESPNEMATGPVAETKLPPLTLMELTVEEMEIVLPEADMTPPPNWKSTLLAKAATGSARANTAKNANRLIFGFSKNPS